MKDEARYRIYANIVTLAHFFWTFLVFGGAFYVIFNHSYAVTEIVVLSITLLIDIPFGNVCPLTLIEEKLRRKFNPEYKNHGSFMTTYINKIFRTGFSVKKVNASISVAYAIFYSIAVFALVR